MKFDDLENVCDAIHHAQFELGLHQEWWGAGNLATSTPGYEMIKLIQRTRRGLHDSQSQTTRPGDQSFLWKLLEILRRVECGDQRDLIFAFLAFQNGEGLVLNKRAYEDSVLEVWMTVAERIVRTSSSLDIFAALSGNTSPTGNRPSWVPDWANCFPYGRPVATPLSCFNACRGLPHQRCHADDPYNLRVRGKIIDTFSILYPTFGPVAAQGLKGNDVSSFLSWACILQNAVYHLYTPGVWERLGNYLDIKRSNTERDLMRTLIADGTLGSKQPIRRIDKLVHAMARGEEARQWRYDRASLTDEQTQLVADYELLEDLVVIAQHKNIFFTEHLQLGLAARIIQEGDLVAILHGSKDPIILRKLIDKDNEYQAVCQCYLDGWMYGKFPSEVFGKTEKDPSKSPHPHGRWWNEDLDDFILV